MQEGGLLDKNRDLKFMRMALKEAQEAFDSEEVPVGCVIVANGGDVIARAHNLTELLKDPTAHAEMQAITAATAALGGKYLDRCTAYVTIEPCPMCAAAFAWAQTARIVYGAPDPKRGYSRFSPLLLHPKTEVVRGVLADECAEIVKEFFKSRRPVKRTAASKNTDDKSVGEDNK